MGQSTFTNKTELLPGFISGSEVNAPSDLVRAASSQQSHVSHYKVFLTLSLSLSLSLSITHTTNIMEGLTRTVPKYLPNFVGKNEKIG